MDKKARSDLMFQAFIARRLESNNKCRMPKEEGEMPQKKSPMAYSWLPDGIRRNIFLVPGKSPLGMKKK